MPITLGVNTTFAINRIVEPERLVGVIAQEVGLRRIQLIPEHLDPNWPAPLVRSMVARFGRACESHGVRVTTMLTGTQIRVNQLAHPDPDVRAFWLGWMKRYVAIAADLGAEGAGSQFGILTYDDDRDPARRRERFAVALDLWRQVGEAGKGAGLKYLLWEPMSVRREFGETIAACRNVQEAINVDGPLPFKMNLDVDHGDTTSPDPRDRDPYAWLEAFGRDAPVVHIKQSSSDKGGHWPFTAEHNRGGRITPDRVVAALRDGSSDDNELVFELSFRERYPTDDQAIAALKDSVAFWKGSVAI